MAVKVLPVAFVQLVLSDGETRHMRFRVSRTNGWGWTVNGYNLFGVSTSDGRNFDFQWSSRFLYAWYPTYEAAVARFEREVNR